jgi:predicted permease
MFESWAIDARYALRRLRRRPTYTLLTVLTLALGVAGTAAVAGVARQLLLEPLPIRAEEEVVAFHHELSWSEAEYDYLRPELDGFEELAAFRPAGVTLLRGDAPALLVEGISATSGLFRLLGREAALGTTFRPEDEVLGSEPVVVLSHALWRDLGADPGIVGERLELSGTPRAVIGVMPEGFWFPDPTARIWLAQTVDPESRSGNYSFLARMPAGAAIADVEPEIATLQRLLRERWDYPPEWDPTLAPELTPIRQRILGPVRPSVLALLAGMAALLLVASVNVSALMLGQVDARGGELALRRALGAGRKRVVQQVVIEALAIGLLAGVAGAALAAAGFRFLTGALPLGALAETASLDWGVFGSALAVALLAATGVALAPALSVTRRDPRSALARGRTGGVDARGGRTEHALVVAQVALVLLLTAGAALLVRSVENFRSIDPGIDVEGVAVLDLLLPGSIELDRVGPTLSELSAAAAAVPGVESVGFTQHLPLRHDGDNWGVDVEDRPELTDTTTAVRMVTPGYFEALNVDLLAGRFPESGDRDPGAESAALVVNEAWVATYFPGESPDAVLGRRVSYTGRWDRIVGVVGNVAEAFLSPDPVPTGYLLPESVEFVMTRQTLVARVGAGLDPASVLDPLRRAVQGQAPDVAVREVTTLDSVFTRAIGPPLQVMVLMVALACLALVLGAVGVYGVVSHSVARGRRDWGIKMALGMRPAEVAGRVLRRGGEMIGLGLVLGLLAFLLLSRLLASFLYGVGTADPPALAAAAGVLLLAGLVAAAVPARRAMRVDLAEILRNE